jgi:predicted transcriptional regulator
MHAISLKLPESLDRRLTERARQSKTTKSAVLRKALEAFLARRPKSVTELAGDLVGKWDGPEDLSTNPRHMAGYGK